jgi:RNA polymerase-interacting CarD/CdnL/TRCF family regulator
MNPKFETGSSVVYGLHGRCIIKGVENKNIGDQVTQFYILEIQKSALSRSQRNEPAIWLPVESAETRGLRNPMSPEQAAQIIEILSNKEYYFSVNEPWSAIHPQLEKIILREGAIGLAKVVGYLHVLRLKQHVLSPEIARFAESIEQVLAREYSETTGEQIRIVNEKFHKALRHKNLLDH